MSIDKIIIEDSDNKKEVAIKTVLLFAGSPALKTEMKKLKVDYTKIQQQGKVKFVLKNKEFGKTTVVL